MSLKAVLLGSVAVLAAIWFIGPASGRGPAFAIGHHAFGNVPLCSYRGDEIVSFPCKEKADIPTRDWRGRDCGPQLYDIAFEDGWWEVYSAQYVLDYTDREGRTICDGHPQAKRDLIEFDIQPVAEYVAKAAEFGVSYCEMKEWGYTDADLEASYDHIDDLPC